MTCRSRLGVEAVVLLSHPDLSLLSVSQLHFESLFVDYDQTSEVVCLTSQPSTLEEILD